MVARFRPLLPRSFGVTHPQRTYLLAVLVAAFLPAWLLAASNRAPGPVPRRTASAVPDSLFKRARITKAKSATACKAALDSAEEKGFDGVDTDVKRLPPDARDTARRQAYLKVGAGYKAAAQICVRRFQLATADSTDVQALIELYSTLGMESRIPAALDRRIVLATTTELRAERMLKAVEWYSRFDSTPGRAGEAEPYVARIDALGDSALVARIEAHAVVARLLSVYHPTDPRARVHADQALALARSLAPDARNKKIHQGRGAYVTAVTTAADEDASNGDYKTALALLNEAIATMGDTATSSEVKDMLRSFRRYALVGTPALPVGGEHWINAPVGTTTMPYRGRVTMLEFTTTWCVWCKKGYPAMRHLAAKYQAQGYHPIFVSLIEGTGMDKPAIVDSELAYDRKHWVDGDSIAFPIAIYDTKVVVRPPPKKDSTSKRDSVSAKADKVETDSAADSTDEERQHRGRPLFFSEYLVDGYPLYYFIDKNGIIRDVELGYSTDMEQRFAGIIERLLAEPGPAQ